MRKIRHVMFDKAGWIGSAVSFQSAMNAHDERVVLLPADAINGCNDVAGLWIDSNG